MNRRKRIGFTLVELMVVVSIIGILASIAIPKFSNLVRKAQEGQTKGNLGVLRSAFTIYYADMEGYFPWGGPSVSDNDTLDTLTVNGKYLSTVPVARSPYYHPPGTSSYSCYRPFISDISAAIATCGGDMFNGEWAAGSFGLLPPTGWLIVSPTATNHVDQTNEVIAVNCTHTDTKGTAWTMY